MEDVMKQEPVRHKRAQSGEGKLGCIIWLALLAGGILVGYKTIPVKIASSELYDFMDEQTKWAATTKPEVLRNRIFAKAKELDLPLEANNLLVERAGDNIKMRATFTVPIEFPGYVYNWDFDFQLNKAIFIF
jgi:hypothetical protein